ncbi:MAG: exodeoxyribonuclease VII large subunit, partial [Gemmatimonadales bacterium]
MNHGAKITAVPGTTRESAVTVSVLNESTKQLVESQFGQFWIKGEISNFKPHQNGHW